MAVKASLPIFKPKGERCFAEHRTHVDPFPIPLPQRRTITSVHDLAENSKRKAFNIKRKKMIGEKKFLC